MATSVRAGAAFTKARWTGGKSPLAVTFSLTNRCNFRCEYCDLPGQQRAELSADRWCEIIDELHAAGLGRASLIGGEPLLRADAGKVIAHLRRRGVHTAMNTNGWYVADRLEELQGLDLVNLTLDGPEAVHDGQRRAGSYRRVIEAMGLLRRRGVPVVTMTVVTPAGIDHVDHVLEVARDHGTLAWFQVEHDKAFDVEKPIAPGIAEVRVKDLARHLLARKAAGWPVGNSRPVLEKQIRDGHRIGGTCDGCVAGRFMAYVLPDGTVAPCLLTQWQVTRGNGAQHGVLRAFRDLAPPRGRGCGCVPYQEMQAVLTLEPAAIFDALGLVVAGWRPRAPLPFA